MRRPGRRSPTPTGGPVRTCSGSGRGPSASSVGELRLTQPATSKHLRVLRDAGLVRVRTDAQRRIYALDPAPLAELDTWLAPYRALWNDRLDALGRHLDGATDETQER